MSHLTGSEHKLAPKLRLIRNGSQSVNAIRAEHCAALSSELVVPEQRGDDAEPKTKAAFSTDEVRKPTLVVDRESTAHVFVTLTDHAEREGGSVALGSTDVRRFNLATTDVAVKDLDELSSRPEVAYVEIGEPMTAPTPEVIAGAPRAPSLSARKIGDGRAHHNARGVLVGVIDVGGFDFSHPDFLNPDGSTRFVAIWDQGGTRGDPAARSANDHACHEQGRYGEAFGYGREMCKDDLDRALEFARTGPPDERLPAHLLEVQSQMSRGSHGTHVASIAAGNRGVAREADIAGVLVHIPEEEDERRRNFYDSVRLAHAIEYLLLLADERNQALVINVSLGTNGHAHDGSSTINRWIDSALSVPGRALVAAAGNAGQDLPAFEGDTGYVMGRVHTSGRVAAAGLEDEINWIVAGNSISDVSENELEIWYEAPDRFAVSVETPDGQMHGPVVPGEFIENRQLPDGSMLSIYNETYHPANGDNYIAVYLSPFFSESGVIGVKAGKWTVHLHGNEVRSGTYHAWIERDDPRRIGRIGSKDAWIFPSFFAAGTYVDGATVGSLACGHRIMSVANYDSVARGIHHTSSQGPTRDGRSKPDVAAPGSEVVAADGFGEQGWLAMTGTSMASPYVTGVVALMLAVNRDLTAAQIEGIVHRTARPLPGIDYRWQDNAGFGVINPDACLAEVKSATMRTDLG